MTFTFKQKPIPSKLKNYDLQYNDMISLLG